jgi:hypothetical protein
MEGFPHDLSAREIYGGGDMIDKNHKEPEKTVINSSFEDISNLGPIFNKKIIGVMVSLIRETTHDRFAGYYDIERQY